VVRLFPLAIALWATTALAADVRPIEQTLAFEMFALEKQVRANIPAGAEAAWRGALDVATRAALNRDPHGKREALAVLKDIQLALERTNMLQPGRQKDWPNTLGEAFTPHDADEESVRQARADWGNGLADRELGARIDHIDWHRPVYLVDCDMGVLLFISVGQRLGWDIRLVAAPEHAYLHWHLPDGEVVNWDWTTRQSIPDRLYRDPNYAGAPERDPKGRSLSLDFARGYYLAVMSLDPINAETLDKAGLNALLEKHLAADPENYEVLNALGWNYATAPNSAQAKTALDYALRAWAADPMEPDMADTVACAYDANGRMKDARDTELAALRLARKDELDKLRANLASIEAGRLCDASQKL
jgi:hypothetical protein